MPVNPTYPGVYIEEIPSGVRTIRGVATSIAAFIDRFQRGLLNHPVQIFSPGDFEREFGGLDPLSEASYGIYQFFLNGGTEAWVVRVAGSGSAAASLQILSGVGGGQAFTLEAGRGISSNPGAWGNNLRVTIDQPEGVPANNFNLTILLVETRRNQEVVLVTEVFRNLAMDPNSLRFLQRVVNDELNGSKLVRVSEVQPNILPVVNGTLSGEFNAFDSGGFPDSPMVNVSIGTDGEAIARLGETPSTLPMAAEILESAIRAARPEIPSFAQAEVTVLNDRLRVLAGPIRPGFTSRLVVHQEGSGEVRTTLGMQGGTSVEGLLSQPISDFPNDQDQLQIMIGESASHVLTLDTSANLSELRTTLEAQIRTGPGEAYTNARVLADTEEGDRLFVLAGLPGQQVTFSSVEAQEDVLANLGLNSENAIPIQAFLSAVLPDPVELPAGEETERTLSFSVGGLGPFSVLAGDPGSTSLTDVATSLQTAMQANRANPVVAGIRVFENTDPDNRLIVIPQRVGSQIFFGEVTGNEVDFLEEDVPDNQTVTLLQLTEIGGVQANVQTYALGAGPAVPNSGQGLGVPGNDGDPPGAQALMGNLSTKTGIHALEDVDLFNILCLPRASQVTGDHALTPVQSRTVMTLANNYCERRRAFYIVDIPSNRNEVPEAKSWLQESGLAGRRNAAVYFPRVSIPDPLDEFRLRTFGASGTLAGLYAKTDSARGVWKAPAGTEAKLANVQGFEYLLNDPENGTLNQRGINCLRHFPVFGRVSWGARTLDGDDQIGSEWNYISVRRTALFIEESLFRGTQWVVFEPNDEPLWAQIRLNVGAFMHNLFRQGAFQGSTPRDAYLVKCDSETTTQNDINLGRVNIRVGFAPLKPAEFVIIQIQQLAGEIQT